ncbi:MAG: BamA/TamA family outer membrane protein [Syntrophobacterales bacterium]|nr:BamA/TamA family outer membrane protein [Syntrophobacterales bacterium]
MAKYRSFHTLILVMVLLLFAAPLFAGEPLTVAIEGIEGDVLENVKAALALPEGFVEEGAVEPLLLKRFGEQAERKVQTALEPFGYYHAAITVRREEKAPGEFLLQVGVTPGEPVRLTDVSVVLHGPGATEVSLQELAALFPLVKGDVLLQHYYEDAKERLFAKAQELGYLDAAFFVHEILVDRDALSAQIKLELETGSLYYFGSARIEGAPDYPEAFLRRYLAFRPGDLFSYERIGDTQLNFINSERFQEVNILPQKGEAAGSRIPVLVSLKPGASRTLRQGIGYGTDTGGRFSLRYRDLNILNLGHELQSNLYVSEFLQGLSTWYIIPDKVDINSYSAVQLNLQREDISTYRSEFAAVEFDKTRSLTKKMLATGYLKFQQENYKIGLQDSNARLVMPGVRFSGNFYDSFAHPEKGFHYALEVRGTEQWLGSSMGLLQIISEAGFILPLPWRLFFHTRGKAGISLLRDPLSDLPPSLRFFAGGDQSVRGYAYQSLGPTDASGQVVGGKNLLYGSLEAERRIGDNWGASVFYDTGNAFDSFSNSQMAQGAGVGVHYYTLVGALNFFVARQLNVDDPGMRIHFTVGIGF